MENNDYIERTNFKSLIEEDGYDRIQDRLNIIDVFLGIEKHVTLEEMYRLVKEKG
ncbi:MAG: Fur family transcriptional regulator, partial [Deltaproteobacteria bacterium]|nr:Fur family transcriptional regulator [Deltaproteobacteria bacterium]